MKLHRRTLLSALAVRSVWSYHTITVTTTKTEYVLYDPSPITTPPPPLTEEAFGTSGHSAEYLTISISNVYGRHLSLSFGSNVGVPTPLNDPPATSLSNASVTRYLFPTGWAGRVAVGPNLDPYGSKIEASFTGPPDVDISYVDGFSVPITCSSEGVPVSGCNIDLFRQPNLTCQHPRDGPVCYNPAQNIPAGPALPFFAVCQGRAYTFPDDDGANAGGLRSKTISCCVGTSCRSPARHKDPDHATSRDVEKTPHFYLQSVTSTAFEGSPRESCSRSD